MQGCMKLVVIEDHHTRQLDPVNPVSESADNNYQSIVTLQITIWSSWPPALHGSTKSLTVHTGWLGLPPILG